MTLCWSFPPYLSAAVHARHHADTNFEGTHFIGLSTTERSKPHEPLTTIEIKTEIAVSLAATDWCTTRPFEARQTMKPLAMPTVPSLELDSAAGRQTSGN